jgi:DNA-binding MarR family transcriptional regulator
LRWVRRERIAPLDANVWRTGRKEYVFERRFREDDWGSPVPEPAPGPRVGSLELQKAHWLLAADWRRRVARACAEEGLTFTEWLIIDALRELYQELGDAVSQAAIATRTGLLPGNISDSVPALEKKLLVSRGPGASGRAWRVFPTAEAERQLTTLYPRLDAISRSVSGR